MSKALRLFWILALWMCFSPIGFSELQKVEYAGEIPFQKGVKWKHFCVDSVGRIYLAEAGRKNILVYNKFGSQIDTLTLSEKSYFAKGGDLAVDRDGNICLVDSAEHFLQKASPNGASLFVVGSRGTSNSEFRTPLGLDMDEDGFIYVADTGNRRIQIWSDKGVYLGSIVSGDTLPAGSGDYRLVQPEGFTGKPIPKLPLLKSPVAVCVNREGLLFVLDSFLKYIFIYSKKGEYLGNMDLKTATGKQDIDPVDIQAREKEIFVLDQKYQNIKVLDLRGTLVQEIGSKGTGTGQFYEPGAFSILGDMIFVLDGGNHRLQMLRYGSSESTVQKKQDPWARHPTLAVFRFSNGKKKEGMKINYSSFSQKLALAFSDSKKFRVWKRIDATDQGIFETAKPDVGYIHLFPEEVKERVDSEFGIFGTLSGEKDKIQAEVRLVSMKTFSTICAVQKSVDGELEWEKVLPDLVVTIESAFVNSQGAPAAPSGLYAIPSARSIFLRWDKNKEEDLSVYLIFQALKRGGPFQEIGKSRESEFEVTELWDNQEYYFKVKAGDSEGKESKFSEVIPCMTRRIPDFGQVLKVKSKVLPKKTQFSWDNPESETIRQYQVFRADRENGEFKMVGVSEKPQFQESGLEDGKSYFYRVRKVYGTGMLSEFSNSFSCMTDARPKTVSYFEAVSDLPQRVELNWKNAPEDKDVLTYILSRSEFPDGEFHEIVRLSASRRNYKDEKLNNNTTYYYKIKAVDKAGLESDLSTEVFATTKDVPDTPVQLVAESNLPRKVRLSWAPDPLRKDLTCLVYRSETQGGSFKEIAKVTQNLFVDTGLPDFKQYYYFVSTKDKDKLVSAPSAIVEARTKPLPSSPKGVKTLNYQPRKATVLWDKNPEADIDHYSVYQGGKFTGSFKKEIDVKDTVFIDDGHARGLKDATTYYYRVTAVDVDGLESLLSDVASSTTKSLPPTPTGITIEYQSNALTVSWPPVTGADIFGYVVYKNGKKLNVVKSNSFLDSSVTPGMSYRYEICSMDNDQLISPKSDKATFKIAKVDMLKDKHDTEKEEAGK